MMTMLNQKRKSQHVEKGIGSCVNYRVVGIRDKELDGLELNHLI